MRFSPLTQITPANVGQLQVAWTYHMKPAGATARFASSEVTPLVIDGTMYLSTPYSRVVALDPTTGKEVWAYQLPSGNPSTRGVEYWPGDAQTPAQIVFGSSDGKLYSLDAKTGKPNEAFGDNGIVNLNTPEIMQGLPGRNGLSSPPIVYKNLVITGGTTQENPPQGPGRRRARVGHAHRQAGVDVPLDSARRREVQRHLGRRQLEEPLGRQRLGLHHRGRRSAASSTCRSARRRSISTAAIAPATTCSAPAWWRPTPTPGNTSGTSRWCTTTSGTPT